MASPPEPSPPQEERPVQLRNDLNDLYGLFGDLQTTVRGIAATQQDHGVRLVRVERGVTELRTDVTGLRTDVTELRTDVTGLRTDVTELRTDVTELRTDVTELRGDMTGVRGELGGLRTDVDGLRAGQDEILRLLRDRR
jgi:chromosome segregation ATPase